ncbi:MAG: GNAT family N-acetyltransferase [Gammaproteobacteria bacterium]|nr:GNAT family N-acetyltransferase [Gammaproteobacteria bacterium]
MDPTLKFEIWTGRDPALASRIPDLARLRIEVFRDFPYLYAGSLAYEEKYLATYTACPDSVVALVMDNTCVVGASTGLPLAAETDPIKQVFTARGFDPACVFYCGESVLSVGYRGRGVYREFFAARETHARRLGGFAWMALCGVVRPADHPRRPAAYTPLDAIWEKFGYRKDLTLVTAFEWQDLDEASPSAKQMVFWLKRL